MKWPAISKMPRRMRIAKRGRIRKAVSDIGQKMSRSPSALFVDEGGGAEDVRSDLTVAWAEVRSPGHLYRVGPSQVLDLAECRAVSGLSGSGFFARYLAPTGLPRLPGRPSSTPAHAWRQSSPRSRVAELPCFARRRGRCSQRWLGRARHHRICSGT
jgi:hypothetical protein